MQRPSLTGTESEAGAVDPNRGLTPVAAGMTFHLT